MASDPFARKTASRAHDRITDTAVELGARLERLETVVANLARCALCGTPCNPARRYCHAHQWAEGKNDWPTSPTPHGATQT